ncbi:MAG: nicotinamide riboside transporter PnuC [Flavobacteriaceae bacterium]
MNQIFNFLIEPYQNYAIIDVVLEAIAVILGLLSVYFAKRDQIAVYPTGMLSTIIFVYILFKANLLGDMVINAYFFLVSIYGWYFWSDKKEKKTENPISVMDPLEKKWWFIFFIIILFLIAGIYILFDKWNNWSAPIDCFTTGLFFIGMWFMARKRLEHWIFWIVGDIISIPLYLYKGLALTSIQYFIFTLIAIFGYIQWKQIYNSKKVIV